MTNPGLSFRRVSTEVNEIFLPESIAALSILVIVLSDLRLVTRLVILVVPPLVNPLVQTMPLTSEVILLIGAQFLPRTFPSVVTTKQPPLIATTPEVRFPPVLKVYSAILPAPLMVLRPLVSLSTPPIGRVHIFLLLIVPRKPLHPLVAPAVNAPVREQHLPIALPSGTVAPLRTVIPPPRARLPSLRIPNIRLPIAIPAPRGVATIVLQLGARGTYRVLVLVRVVLTLLEVVGVHIMPIRLGITVALTICMVQKAPLPERILEIFLSPLKVQLPIIPVIEPSLFLPH